MRVIILLLLLACPCLGTQRGRPFGQATACKCNLKNIATALEMYSSDHHGHYPASLADLTPKYLKVVPQCPAATNDTYAPSYRRGERPDRYLVYCSGRNHRDAKLPINSPAVSSFEMPLQPDGVKLEQCRANLESAKSGHAVSQGSWTGCWGRHLDQGVAVMERTDPQAALVVVPAAYQPPPRSSPALAQLAAAVLIAAAMACLGLSHELTWRVPES